MSLTTARRAEVRDLRAMVATEKALDYADPDAQLLPGRAEPYPQKKPPRVSPAQRYWETLRMLDVWQATPF
jgi:hypothetical protein